MDIRVECEEGVFKLRSCGVFVKDGKMLVDRARRFDGHIILGGHVRVGENSRETIIREAKEEMGLDVTIEKLICVNENLYRHVSTGDFLQEVSCYYLLNADNLPEDGYEFFEIDNGKEITHKFSWIDLDKLEENNVRPCWIGKMIQDNKENYYYLSDQTK